MLALAAVALIGLTAVVTNRLSTDDPSRFTTELHVTTGVVDAVQGFDAGGASNERVVCVVADRAVASDCYRVPVGLVPDPMPQIGQRVRILHGFMVENLTDPRTSRRNSVVAIEILPDLSLSGGQSGTGGTPRG